MTRSATSSVPPSAPSSISASNGSAPGHTRRLALGWTAPAQLDRRGWATAGVSLAEFGRVNNWWVGDWVRHGNARWGEKHTQAARITGLDGKTLRRIAYVASRFDLSRRRDNLAWTHHAEVAALCVVDQELWLDRAVALRLSPGDLRVELRPAQPASSCDPRAAGPADDGSGRMVTCPHCGALVSAAEPPMR